MDLLNLGAELSSQWWYYVLAGLLGAVFGSFSGVLVERVPNKKSIRPQSACDTCGVPIRWWQNIPIISWLALRGRCAECQTAIPIRLWFIEVTCAAGWVVGAALTNDPVSAAAFGMLVCFSVVLGVIDYLTSYIYWGPYLGFGAATWGLTAAGAVLTGETGRLWLGLAFGFGVAVVMEGSSWLYYLLRKTHGFGGGDAFLVFVVMGVPVALSGDWVVGVYGFILSFVVAAIIGITLASRYAEGVADPYTDEGLRPEREKPTPDDDSDAVGEDEQVDGEAPEKVKLTKRVFALGPYLPIGPIVYWIFAHITGFNPLEFL